MQAEEKKEEGEGEEEEVVNKKVVSGLVTKCKCGEGQVLV